MKKLLTIILAFASVVSSMAFVSCSDKVEQVDLVKDGESAYAIYRADKATDGEKDGGAALRTLINEKTGVRLDYTTDDKFGKIEGKLEIVVGNTNRDASKIAAEGLGENQFRFLMVGDTLAIAASNPDCYEAAAQTFANEYVTESGVSVPADLDRTWQCKPGFNTREVSNPIYNNGGADPYVILHEGIYYHCWAGGGGVKVSANKSLDTVTRDSGSLVWKPEGGKMWSSNIWAPELHYLNGEWYIYVAADDGENANHRMYVLKGTSQDPTKPFTFVGKITDETDLWAIDGTVLQHEGEMYFIWSGWPQPDSGNHQNLYIAHMSDPCTIDSERVLIAAPEQAWEKPLCEGPIAYSQNGEVFIFYSGNGSWTENYCIGYLRLTGSDPMKTKNWRKYPSAILTKSNVAMGPGHCSIALAPDGTPWMMYHANLEEKGWNGRSIWIQPIKFDDEGLPKIMKIEKKVNYPVSAWFVDKEITK